MTCRICRAIAVLLAAAACVFHVACSREPAADRAAPAAMNMGRDHEKPPEFDHSDPENQRRMGIYHYNEGNKFLRKNDPLEAIRNYKMALHHSPDFPEASINLTTAYLQAKQFDEAHKVLQTLQEKNPKNPMLFYNLACYYSLTSKADASLEALQKAVALGYKDFRSIRSDPDLATLRKDPKFTAWIKRF
ncbi:MAG: tetratricopeptide repeat protein [Nitrospinales bacterium]